MLEIVSAGGPASYSPVERECVRRIERERNAASDEMPRGPSCCSQVFFVWPTYTILRGACRRRQLDPDDFPKTVSSQMARLTFPKAKAHWDAQVARYRSQCASGEVKKHPEKDFKPRIARTSRAMMTWHLPWGILCGGIQGFVASFARAKVLQQLLVGMMPRQPGQQSPYTNTGLTLLIVAFATTVWAEGWLKALASQFLSTESGTRWVAWITLLIQQKGSRTSDVKMPKRVADAHKAEKEKKKKNAGWGGGNDAGSNEANLIGNDVLQTFENLRWTSQMPSCIVGLISGMAVLIHILGAAPALCGLSVMFLCLFITLMSGYGATLFSAKDLKAGDERLSVMREIIDSITPVKFMCWENQYLELITEKRSIECDFQLKFRLLMLVNMGIGKASPVLGACTAFAYMGM